MAFNFLREPTVPRTPPLISATYESGCTGGAVEGETLTHSLISIM
jgi:hypothetical protein